MPAPGARSPSHTQRSGSCTQGLAASKFTLDTCSHTQASLSECEITPAASPGEAACTVSASGGGDLRGDGGVLAALASADAIAERVRTRGLLTGDRERVRAEVRVVARAVAARFAARVGGRLALLPSSSFATEWPGDRCRFPRLRTEAAAGGVAAAVGVLARDMLRSASALALRAGRGLGGTLRVAA